MMQTLAYLLHLSLTENDIFVFIYCHYWLSTEKSEFLDQQSKTFEGIFFNFYSFDMCVYVCARA